MFNNIECAEKCDKFKLKNQQTNDVKIRREYFTDENAVHLQLLKKNNLENDEESLRKIRAFLLNYT